MQRRLVVRGQSEAEGAEGIEANVAQTIVTAQEQEVIGAPGVTVVGPGTVGDGVGDVEQAECRQILEEIDEDVARLQDLEAGRALRAQVTLVGIAKI